VVQDRSEFEAPIELPDLVSTGDKGPLQDRRKEHRYPVNQSATVTVLTGAVSSTPATVVDVSRSGLRIRVQCPIWTGAQIEIRTGEVVIFGEVRYCGPPTQSGYDIGIHIEQVIANPLRPPNALHA
jgi:hypothetical protein